MKKIFLLLGIGFVMCSLNDLGHAQPAIESDLKRFEFGGQFTYLRRTVPDATALAFQNNYPDLPRTREPHVSEFGLGARFTYNFTENIAVEAEYNFFPEDKRVSVTNGFPPIRYYELGGKKHQTVFGPKIGYRGKKIGVFGKLRPGFIRLDRYLVIQTLVTTPNSFSISARNMPDLSFFNIDVGGVFEYYPSRRTVFRVDVGDTIIRYGNKAPKEINPSFTRHNLQTNIGFGFRF